MASIKSFLSLIFLCITSLDAYTELSTRRFGKGLVYLYLLLVLTTVVSSSPVLLTMYGLKAQAGAVSDSLKQEVKEFYPPELEIVLENGEVRANVPQPYDIPIPKKIQEVIEEDSANADTRLRNFKHLIEIDTNARIEDYEKRGAIILLTKDSLVFPDKESGLTVRSLANSKNFTLNRAVYDSYVPEATKWIDRIPWLVSVGIPLLVLCWSLVGPCFNVIGYLGYLLLTSLPLLLLAAVLRSGFSYKRIFSTSIYGLTPAILISTVWGIVGSFPPFFFSIIFLSWMSIILVKNSNK